MPKYISNRQKDLKIGISSFSGGTTSLQVIDGNVGLGTTRATSRLNVTGDVRVSGVITATSFRGDGSQLTGISGGGSQSWVGVTTDYTATSGEKIIADTTAGSFTITLPSSPSTGSFVIIADGADWSTNNLIVARNSSTMENLNDDFILDIGGVSVEFVYDGTTWELYANVGVNGQQGVQGVQGIQGIPGIQGADGVNGVQGVQGFSGSNGSQGIQGIGGPSDSIIAANDNSSTVLYPVMVGFGDTTAKISVTPKALSYNASSGNLSVTNIIATGDITASNVNSTSDKSLKINIKNISDSIEILKKINPVEFEWKKTHQKSYGLIAQELEEILPELVNESGGIKSVNYIPIIAFLINAVCDLHNQIHKQ